MTIRATYLSINTSLKQIQTITLLCYKETGTIYYGYHFFSWPTFESHSCPDEQICHFIALQWFLLELNAISGGSFPGGQTSRKKNLFW